MRQRLPPWGCEGKHHATLAAKSRLSHNVARALPSSAMHCCAKARQLCVRFVARRNGLADLRTCGLAALRPCGLAALRTCGLAALRTCGLAVRWIDGGICVLPIMKARRGSGGHRPPTRWQVTVSECRERLVQRTPSGSFRALALSASRHARVARTS